MNNRKKSISLLKERLKDKQNERLRENKSLSGNPILRLLYDKYESIVNKIRVK